MNSVAPFTEFPKSDPQFYFSKNKIPGSPIIMFVHFYGGHQRVLKRHIDLVNEIGFDAFAFNMPDFLSCARIPHYRGRIGLKHYLTKMITHFLNEIPGPKIIFAFSNPSAAAIEAIYDRNKVGRQDVVGLVCDSGPSRPFIQSAWNLAIKVRGQFKLLWLFSFLWSFRLHKEVRYQLKRFPKNFPILSIQGGADEVIPPWHIDLVFRKLENFVHVETFVLPEAGHLDALKNFPEPYRKTLSRWLDRFKS